MTKVIVVNGPNLGRLGVRQPDVYGRQDLETLRTQCSQWGAALGLKVEVRQTDDEAEMVRWMHQAVDEQTPVVMNPAAFTHYSYALADAAHMVGDAGLPLMEVHISNPSARDEFRHQPGRHRHHHGNGILRLQACAGRHRSSYRLIRSRRTVSTGGHHCWCACASGLLRLVWCP